MLLLLSLSYIFFHEKKYNQVVVIVVGTLRYITLRYITLRYITDIMLYLGG